MNFQVNDMARLRRDLDLATGSMLNLSLFPNLIFVGNQLMVVEPLAVDRTRLHLHLMSAPGAARRRQSVVLDTRTSSGHTSCGANGGLCQDRVWIRRDRRRLWRMCAALEEPGERCRER